MKVNTRCEVLLSAFCGSRGSAVVAEAPLDDLATSERLSALLSCEIRACLVARVSPKNQADDRKSSVSRHGWRKPLTGCTKSRSKRTSSAVAGDPSPTVRRLPDFASRTCPSAGPSDADPLAAEVNSGSVVCMARVLCGCPTGSLPADGRLTSRPRRHKSAKSPRCGAILN